MPLAYNLAPIVDFTTAPAFLNIAKMLRPPVAGKGGAWNTMKYNQVLASGVLDADGYPQALPPGMDKVGVGFDWSHPDVGAANAGRYVMTWKGGLTVNIQRATVIESGPNRMVWEYTAGSGKVEISFKNFDPSNPFSDLVIVREEHEALYHSGEILHPDYVKLLLPAKQIRFMDWQNTNNSNVTSWTQQKRPTALTYQTGNRDETGVPVEVMVAVANRVNADPWFCIPELADSNFTTQFAAVVASSLNSNLTPTFERANERWNGSAFAATGQLRTLVTQNWQDYGENGWYSPAMQYGTKLTVEMGLDVRKVFGTRPAEIALGVQTTNGWTTKEMLAADVWKQHEPTAWVDPASVITCLAATSYFGSRTLRDAAMKQALFDKINDPTQDAAGWITASLLDPTYKGSIPQTINALRSQLDIAAQYGLGLQLYEGGQHFHHTFNISNVDPAIIAWVRAYVRSDHMALLYKALWDGLHGIGINTFMQFTDVGIENDRSSFGLRANFYDNPPRAVMLDSLLAAEGTGTTVPDPITPPVIVPPPVDSTNPDPTEPDPVDPAPEPDQPDPVDPDPTDPDPSEPWDEDAETGEPDPPEPDSVDTIAALEAAVAAMTAQVETMQVQMEAQAGLIEVLDAKGAAMTDALRTVRDTVALALT